MKKVTCLLSTLLVGMSLLIGTESTKAIPIYCLKDENVLCNPDPGDLPATPGYVYTCPPSNFVMTWNGVDDFFQEYEYQGTNWCPSTVCPANWVYDRREIPWQKNGTPTGKRETGNVIPQNVICYTLHHCYEIGTYQWNPPSPCLKRTCGPDPEYLVPVYKSYSLQELSETNCSFGPGYDEWDETPEATYPDP